MLTCYKIHKRKNTFNKFARILTTLFYAEGGFKFRHLRKVISGLNKLLLTGFAEFTSTRFNKDVIQFSGEI